MTFLMYTLHVLICFFLIAVVLLQQGKGADLSVFGGGGTQTAFGARGAATVLHKLTVGSFIAFILTTLAIGVLQTREDESQVLSTLPEAEETATADEEPEEEAGALPTEDPADESGEADATEDSTADDGADNDEGADTGDAEPVAEDAAPADDAEPGAEDEGD